MLDIGWSELLVIAVVAIIFVGPRDLIPMLRTFGQYAAKLKKMAGEFQSQFNDALREAELDDIQKTVSDVRKMKPLNALKDQFESEMGEIGKMTESIKPDSAAADKPEVAKVEKASGATKPPGNASKTPASKTPAKKTAARTGTRKTPARKKSASKAGAGKAPGTAAAKKSAAGKDKPGSAGGEA